MRQPDVSVIIVAYKSQALVNTCIASVLRWTKEVTFEIIVVDNAADSEAAFQLEVPAGDVPVTIIPMEYNAGFSRANNRAFAVANGRAFLLLNPDTELVSDAVSICFSHLMKGNALACGTQLVFPNGQFQMSGWHFTPGNTGFFLKLPYMKKLYDRVRRRPAQLQIDHDNPRKVDWINGAFFMVKRETVATCGGLDEEFFLYAEEPEWCARMGRHGNLVVYPYARVIHKVGGVTDTAYESSASGYFYIFDQRGLQMLVSELLRTRKQYGRGWLLFHYLVFFFYNPVFWLLSAVDHVMHKQSAAYGSREIAGYARNTWRSGYYVWRILRSKPFFYKVM